MSTCNGKCYLAQKLKKAEEKEKQAPVSKKERIEIVYFYSNIPLSPQNLPLAAKILSPTGSEEKCFSTYVADIYHPPKLILI